MNTEIIVEDLEGLKNNRIGHLQRMLDDEKRELLKKVSRHSQAILNSKKYRAFKTTLQQRVIMADNFIKNISDTFFTMLADKEFLMLTTQIDVIQKIQRFKKNVLNSLQKLTHHLQPKSESKLQLQKIGSNYDSKEEQQEEIQKEDEQYEKKGKSKTKSKNFKISSDATRSMMEWLLVNFENPYPTIQEKQEMAREGKISIIKVNNWFINARQRTVKGYFQKDN